MGLGNKGGQIMGTYTRDSDGKKFETVTWAVHELGIVIRPISESKQDKLEKLREYWAIRREPEMPADVTDLVDLIEALEERLDQLSKRLEETNGSE
jgi:hypothetical protein